jgi:hypothetical protein
MINRSREKIFSSFVTFERIAHLANEIAQVSTHVIAVVNQNHMAIVRCHGEQRVCLRAWFECRPTAAKLYRACSDGLFSLSDWSFVVTALQRQRGVKS